MTTLIERSFGFGHARKHFAAVLARSFRAKVIDRLECDAERVASASTRSFVIDCIESARHSLDAATDDPAAVCRANEFVALAQRAMSETTPTREPTPRRAWINEESNLWRVACHEAAHAVMLFTMNALPAAVRVDGDGPHEVRGGSTTLSDSVRGEKRLMLLLAGGVAEEIVSCRAARWDGADARDVAGELALMGWSASDPRLAALRADVEQRLRRNARAVNVLAIELYRRAPQPMSRAEVVALVNDAAGIAY